ncbi:MAG: lytic transglycosylase domain-containing protein [Firmicutes bacterium]|jgi:soluble lytic murein transglycosylase|nr:lytic transglycosylase domain-containing protein [Bacillota bacterium]HPU02189.1 lytic transglycosylase domain-containing protein [Bacillota bacterium]
MVKRALQRLFYLAAFILLFGLTCSLLSSPRLEKLFYPFHYREEILAAAAEQQIDPLLIAAVIQAESGFREDAVSAEGARGLMQLLPSTARWIAERRGESDFHPDKLFDPRYNIAAGSWYLADLLRQFHGSKVIALAAYNGGRGRVQRWLEEEIWDGSEAGLEQIPFSETRAFVRRVLDNYRRYRRLYGKME